MEDERKEASIVVDTAAGVVDGEEKKIIVMIVTVYMVMSRLLVEVRKNWRSTKITLRLCCSDSLASSRCDD